MGKSKLEDRFSKKLVAFFIVKFGKQDKTNELRKLNKNGEQ